MDASKGDKERPEYRCTLVAKGIRKDKRSDLLAATPPAEAEKVLFSLFASSPGLCLDFIDVARAYVHATSRRRVCVDLLMEDHHDVMRGRLKKAMNGREMPHRTGSWGTAR